MQCPKERLSVFLLLVLGLFNYCSSTEAEAKRNSISVKNETILSTNMNLTLNQSLTNTTEEHVMETENEINAKGITVVRMKPRTTNRALPFSKKDLRKQRMKNILERKKTIRNISKDMSGKTSSTASSTKEEEKLPTGKETDIVMLETDISIPTVTTVKLQNNSNDRKRRKKVVKKKKGPSARLKIRKRKKRLNNNRSTSLPKTTTATDISSTKNERQNISDTTEPPIKRYSSSKWWSRGNTPITPKPQTVWMKRTSTITSQPTSKVTIQSVNLRNSHAGSSTNYFGRRSDQTKTIYPMYFNDERIFEKEVKSQGGPKPPLLVRRSEAVNERDHLIELEHLQQADVNEIDQEKVENNKHEVNSKKKLTLFEELYKKAKRRLAAKRLYSKSHKQEEDEKTQFLKPNDKKEKQLAYSFHRVYTPRPFSRGSYSHNRLPPRNFPLNIPFPPSSNYISRPLNPPSQAYGPPTSEVRPFPPPFNRPNIRPSVNYPVPTSFSTGFGKPHTSVPSHTHSKPTIPRRPFGSPPLGTPPPTFIISPNPPSTRDQLFRTHSSSSPNQPTGFVNINQFSRPIVSALRRPFTSNINLQNPSTKEQFNQPRKPLPPFPISSFPAPRLESNHEFGSTGSAVSVSNQLRHFPGLPTHANSLENSPQKFVESAGSHRTPIKQVGLRPLLTKPSVPLNGNLSPTDFKSKFQHTNSIVDSNSILDNIGRFRNGLRTTDNVVPTTESNEGSPLLPSYFVQPPPSFGSSSSGLLRDGLSETSLNQGFSPTTPVDLPLDFIDVSPLDENGLPIINTFHSLVLDQMQPPFKTFDQELSKHNSITKTNKPPQTSLLATFNPNSNRFRNENRIKQRPTSGTTRLPSSTVFKNKFKISRTPTTPSSDLFSSSRPFSALLSKPIIPRGPERRPTVNTKINNLKKEENSNAILPPSQRLRNKIKETTLLLKDKQKKVEREEKNNLNTFTQSIKDIIARQQSIKPNTRFSPFQNKKTVTSKPVKPHSPTPPSFIRKKKPVNVRILSGPAPPPPPHVSGHKTSKVPRIRPVNHVPDFFSSFKSNHPTTTQTTTTKPKKNPQLRPFFGIPTKSPVKTHFGGHIQTSARPPKTEDIISNNAFITNRLRPQNVFKIGNNIQGSVNDIIRDGRPSIKLTNRRPDSGSVSPRKKFRQSSSVNLNKDRGSEPDVIVLTDEKITSPESLPPTLLNFIDFSRFEGRSFIFMRSNGHQYTVIFPLSENSHVSNLESENSLNDDISQQISNLNSSQ